MKERDKRAEFMRDLSDLLSKYNCTIEADDHWTGYAECGQDIKMTVEFKDWAVDDIDLGSYVYAAKPLEL